MDNKQACSFTALACTKTLWPVDGDYKLLPKQQVALKHGRNWKSRGGCQGKWREGLIRASEWDVKVTKAGFAVQHPPRDVTQFRAVFQNLHLYLLVRKEFVLAYRQILKTIISLFYNPSDLVYNRGCSCASTGLNKPLGQYNNKANLKISSILHPLCLFLVLNP